MGKEEEGPMDDLSLIGLMFLILWAGLLLSRLFGNAPISEVLIWTMFVIAVILLVGGHILWQLGRALKK